MYPSSIIYVAFCTTYKSDIMELKESNVYETTMQDDDHYEPVDVEENKNTDGEQSNMK